MNEEPVAIRAFRFGIFELDLRARELRKGGVGLKLDVKLLETLELLLEKAGELVTRKQLRERLWPDTFVDFDRCINTAICKLRKTLGDTKGSPRYIETRSRLGYRFIAPMGPPDVATRPALPPAPPDATLADRPFSNGFGAHGPSPLVAFAALANPNPKADGDELRFQVRHPDGNLTEFSVTLTTTRNGIMNVRLDFRDAGSEEGQRLSGLCDAGPNYAGSIPRTEPPLRRARP